MYDAHAQAMFGYLLNFTRSETETHDALQEVFRKLTARPAVLDSVREERSFLLKLAHNAALDQLRRRMVRRRYHERYAAESAGLFAPAGDPDLDTFRQALSKGLEALPAGQRSVVHLKLWEGLTFEQIAGVLGISANTAASRYRYGIDKLQEQLRPIYEEIKGHE